LSKLKIEDKGLEVSKMETLKNLIAFESISDEDKKIAEEAGLTLYLFDDVIAKGKKIADDQ